MYSFIDIEASGFGYGSYPIEVGVAMADGETHCMLIEPLPQWIHWDMAAEDLHGISRNTLLAHGRSVFEVADCLNRWLEGCVVYTDAWGNDSAWLSLLFSEAKVPQRFRLDSVVSLLNPRQIELWQACKADVVKRLGVSRHRASSDALILQQTFSALDS